MTDQPTGNTLILDCHIEADLGGHWSAGALPVLDPGGTPKTGADRGTYFAGRTSQLLYADGTASNAEELSTPLLTNRWSRSTEFQVAEGIEIVAFEVLAAVPFASLRGPKRQNEDNRRIAVLICHVKLTPTKLSESAVTELWKTTRDREGRNTFYKRLQAKLGKDVSLGGRGQSSFDGDNKYLKESRRIYSVFLEENARLDNEVVSQFGEDSALAMRVRVAATLTPDKEVGGLDRGRIDRAVESMDVLSASWVTSILRDGAAFVMRPKQQFAPARMLVSTIYTDAFAFVRLQAAIVEELVHAAGTLAYDPAKLTLQAVAVIQRDLTYFRSLYRKSSLNPANRSRKLLARLENQLGLDESISALGEELADLVNIATLDQQVRQEAHIRRVDSLLALLTIAGFPLTIALSVWGDFEQLNTLPGLLILSASALVLGLATYALVFRRSRASAGLLPVPRSK